MKETLTSPDLWSSNEFAKYMGWSSKALYHRIRAGAELPDSICIGKKRYFKRVTVIQWIDGLEGKTTASKAVA